MEEPKLVSESEIKFYSKTPFVHEVKNPAEADYAIEEMTMTLSEAKERWPHLFPPPSRI